MAQIEMIGRFVQQKQPPASCAKTRAMSTRLDSPPEEGRIEPPLELFRFHLPQRVFCGLNILRGLFCPVQMRGASKQRDFKAGERKADLAFLL